MLHLRRLTQAGFVLSAEGTSLLIDAFLAPRPDLLAQPVAPSTLTGIDAILATHEHRDHLDMISLPGLVAASPEARVIVPLPLVERASSVAAADHVIGAEVDQEITVGAARIHPIPARHGVTMADAYDFGLAMSGGHYRFLGYVIELGGVRVYHAGDTIRYDGMAERLRALRPDLALLPINGRDEEREARGLVGNLDPKEAADLASDAGIPALIPMHYDTIKGNTGSADALRAYAAEGHPGLKVVEMAPNSERDWPSRS
jgi:L-ascorbate metabolism protein UlaG (beta-lactamase superfamily)